jgi:trehalose 2-sulfotransferase
MSPLHAQIFGSVEHDPAIFETIMQRPEPTKKYVVYFTPRSGSSWLTDILRQTNGMGLANELFNPNFMPGIARVVHATDIHQYIDATQRRLHTRGTFGFEITFHQLKAIFPGERVFINHFGQVPCFWLVREDVVEQAVSLVKMVVTKVAHSPNASEEQRRASDTAFEYDAAKIKWWLQHILAAEQGNEAFFKRHGMTPLRMSYESIMRLGPESTVRLMAKHVGVGELLQTQFVPKHEKIGTSRNRDYAARFRQDEADFLAEVDAQRTVTLARLDDLSACVAE